MKGGKLRVLLADDHPALLDALHALLVPSYEVVAAVTDGRSLVQTALALEPDLIVSDIAMPGLNGLDAVISVKRQLPGVHVVFFTCDVDPDMVAEALRRGAAGYVAKAAAASELLEAMRQVVKGHIYVALT